MSLPQPPQPAKLIVGFFLKEKQLAADLAEDLRQRFGELDLISPWMNFNMTDYYQREMGAPLFRRMLAFKELIDQDTLARVKIQTNGIESRFQQGAGRRLNIDPGYLVPERLVLATGKNYSHRIYIGRGIYADLTLIFKKGDFCPLPWTYPDYARPEMFEFLNRVRRKYLRDLKSPERRPE